MLRPNLIDVGYYIPAQQAVARPRGINRAAVFRQAQHNVAHSVPKCAMVVLIDVGDDDDIHPRNKRVVGERMVLAARSVAYDEPIKFSGPVLDRISFNGKKANKNMGQAHTCWY